MRAREIRLDWMVGRMVKTANHRPVGRLEEIRARQQGGSYVITEYILGPAGLLERLGLGLRLLFVQKRARGYVARWDQLDVSDPKRPRLRCPVEELREASD